MTTEVKTKYMTFINTGGGHWLIVDIETKQQIGEVFYYPGSERRYVAQFIHRGFVHNANRLRDIADFLDARKTATTL